MDKLSTHLKAQSVSHRPHSGFVRYNAHAAAHIQTLAQRLKSHVNSASVTYIHNALSTGKRMLTEGTNTLMLNIGFCAQSIFASSTTTIGVHIGLIEVVKVEFVADEGYPVGFVGVLA